MSNKQLFLWDRILEVLSSLNDSNDALEKWEKQMLLKVLLKQLKDDIGDSDFKKLIIRNRRKLTAL